MMKVEVVDTLTANKLNNAILNGNCMVLYHMEGCPYCVQMMPEWTNFTQLAKKTLPNLTIGEVEKAHIDKLNNVGVTGFPTIIFYKSGTGMPHGASQNNLNQSNFKNLLKNIMNDTHHQVQTENDNGITFKDNRTTDKLIKFAKDNLTHDTAKGKKKKIIKNTLKRVITKAKKTKKVEKKNTQNLSNALAELDAIPKSNSNQMNLTNYKKAKKRDIVSTKQIKKALNM